MVVIVLIKTQKLVVLQSHFVPQRQSFPLLVPIVLSKNAYVANEQPCREAKKATKLFKAFGAPVANTNKHTLAFLLPVIRYKQIIKPAILFLVHVCLPFSPHLSVYDRSMRRR